MKIERMSGDEQVALCRKAERLCGRRLRDLRRFADPHDRALHKILDERIEDLNLQLKALERLGRGAAPDGPGESEEAGRFIRSRFPSHTNGFGEGPLIRDVALYLAECLEDERSRFYHEMAAAAREEEARSLFQQLADRDEAHLKFLRTVLLVNLAE